MQKFFASFFQKRSLPSNASARRHSIAASAVLDLKRRQTQHSLARGHRRLAVATGAGGDPAAFGAGAGRGAGAGPCDGCVATRDRCGHGFRVWVSRRWRFAFCGDASGGEPGAGVQDPAVGAGDQRVEFAAALPGFVAVDNERFCVGVAADVGDRRGFGAGRGGAYFPRHDRGAAAHTALSGAAAKGRAFCADELRNGGRRGNHDGAVCHRAYAGDAGCLEPDPGGERDQYAGGAGGGGAAGAVRGERDRCRGFGEGAAGQRDGCAGARHGGGGGAAGRDRDDAAGDGGFGDLGEYIFGAAAAWERRCGDAAGARGLPVQAGDVADGRGLERGGQGCIADEREDGVERVCRLSAIGGFAGGGAVGACAADRDLFALRVCQFWQSGDHDWRDGRHGA